MKPLKVLLISIIFIGGCATANQVYTPDGQKGYSINCSGSVLNWGMCYEKAGDICGAKGYVVLGAAGDSGDMISWSQFGLIAGSVINRTMIIKCKE